MIGYITGAKPGIFCIGSIDNGFDSDDLSNFSLQGEEYYAAEKLRIQLVKDLVSPRNLEDRKSRDPSLVFSCGAGKVGAYINYDATLSPCAAIRDRRFNLMELSFADAWQQLVNHIQAQENLVISGCNPNCSAKSVCKMCPAVALRDQEGNYRVNPAYCKQQIALAKVLAISS